MAADSSPVKEPGSTNQLHPLIYWIIVGLCGWLVLSFWGFFASGSTGLALAVASLFIAVAVAIRVLLWRISLWRRNSGAEQAEQPRFADWLAGDFEAWAGRQRGLEAALEVLLPIAAVSIGMSVFAVVLHLDIYG